MKPSAWRTAAVALLFTGALTSAQAQEPRKDDKAATVSLLLRLLQQYVPEKAALAGKTCPKTQTICTIDMQLINVGGRDYCLAIAPEVEVQTDTTTTPTPPKKNVAWKLSPAALGGKDLAFHRDSGIILTVDAKAQIEKGGSGSGTPISPPNAYHVKTKRDKLGAESAYLPVILWGPPGKEELCAAIDPRIVNVD